jgi:hypothetical protein
MNLYIYENRLETSIKKNNVNEILSYKKTIENKKKELFIISKQFSKSKKIKKIKKDDNYYLKGMSSPLGRMADDP